MKKIKRVCALLLTVTLLLSMVVLPAHASVEEAAGVDGGLKLSGVEDVDDSNICGDNLTWSLDEEGTLTISGTGAMYDYSPDFLAPWHSSDLGSVRTLVVEEGVTTIGDYAFWCCSRLTSITIGDSVTTIGYSAFEFCDNVRTVTIPASVTTIRNGAFSIASHDSIDVNYQGSREQWAAISIGSYNKALTDGTIYYRGNDNGVCGDNLTWSLDEEGTLTISGAGAMYDYSGDSLAPWYDNQAAIMAVVVEEGVTTVGQLAFALLESLTSVKLANSVITIGGGAFGACTSLTGVVIPEGVTTIGDSAFVGCKNLTGVDIPESVTTIGDSAFYACENLFGVIIPEGVTAIGYEAFGHCDNLTGVVIPESVTTIGDSAFFVCKNLTGVVIPESVTTIGDYAFGACDNLTDVYYSGTEEQWEAISVGGNNDPLINATIHYCDRIGGTCADGLTWIMDTAGVLTVSGTGDMQSYSSPDAPWETFRGCITAVVVEEGVTTIGDWAFWYYPCLTRVTISDSVTTIGKFAFLNCTNLRDVTIGNGVTTIGESAFQSCTGLTGVTIPDSVTTIGESAFQSCTGLTGVKIGNSVTTIGDSAFEKCDSLTDVTIPNGVTTIGGCAFVHCTGLTDVKIGNGVTTISGTAFSGCIGLTDVTIPDSVTAIRSYVFEGCCSLTDVYYGGTPSQWAVITIEFGNEPLTNATIHYAKQDPLTIVTQPVDASAAYEEIAKFTVGAMGVASYQWQYSKDGVKWYNTALSGCDTATLSVPMITSRDGYQYRCKLVDADGKYLYTDVVTLTMEPRISCDPAVADQNVTEGDYATFRVSASGIKSYQWQYSKDGVNWYATQMKGYATDTLTVAAILGRNGYQYRCKLTGVDGTVMYTDPATLTVNYRFKVQPSSVTQQAGSDASFFVEAEGVASLQWQYSKNGSTWYNTTMSGCNTATLSVPVITGRNGYRYRCKLTLENGTVIYTDAATLIVK